MNWVGGSRKRLVMKNDAKKQREFFQKQKIRQKLDSMGISQPASPPDSSPGSMDLVTLFIVNQIATKKESTNDPPKVAVLDSCTGGLRNKRNNLVLPMTPCSPSKLELVESSQPQYSLQGDTMEKSVFQQGFKSQQPFPQPSGVTDSTSWSEKPNQPFFQLETPIAAPVLFGSPEKGEQAEQEVTFSLNQSEDTEPMFDFTLNHVETEEQFVEDVFMGFNTDEREASHFVQGKPKIYLRDESPVQTSTPQTVPVSQCMELEEEKCCQLYLQATSSCINQMCCDSDHSHIQSSLFTPQMFYMETQEVVQSVTCTDKAVGGSSHQRGHHAEQIESPIAVAQAQVLEVCECKQASGETQDVGTQTDDKPTAETCDASTQCSFVVHIGAKATAFLVPSFDVSVQHLATGRQSKTTSEPETHTPFSSNVGKREMHSPWKKNKSKSGCFSDHGIISIPSATNSDGKVILQRPINPFVDAQSMADGKDSMLE